LSRLPAGNTRSDRQTEVGMAGANTAIKLTLAADDGQDLRALAERICSGATDGVHPLPGSNGRGFRRHR
jgi:hypothetical protein